MDFSRYTSARRICDKLGSLILELAALIGEQRQQWLTIATGEMVLPGLGLVEEASLLTRYAEHIQIGIFQIIALGACNTGKSTFLNAFLGSDVLPVGPLPTTAIATHILYDTQDTISVFEEGNDYGYNIDRSIFMHDLILSMNDIQTIDSRGSMNNRLQSISLTQVTGPYPYLAHGIRVLDTPGLGVRVRHPSITPGSLQQPGVAILFFLNALHPFPQEVKKFIATTFGSKRRENIFFIINRIDQLPAEEASHLQQTIKQLLGDQFTDENGVFDQRHYTERVFFVSAKTALEAAATSNEKGVKESQLLTVQRELERFFVRREHIAQILEPLFQSLQRVEAKAKQRIAQELAKQSTYEVDGYPFLAFSEKKRLKLIERRLLEILAQIDALVYDASMGRLHEPTARLITSPLPLSIADPFQATIGLDDVDIHAYLRFAQHLIERANIAHPERIVLREQINEIFYRLTDQRLYMAVVGEFNSGKSTLINAFLRQRLLKTSVKVTTATATHIRYASSPNVEVLFKQQKELLSYQKDSTRLWQLINFMSGQEHSVHGDIQECIHHITAVDTVADNVEYVSISHPAPFLSSCVIIDTPGMNAEKEEHAQITRRLIEQEADAALIVIPAPVPLSSTLRDFLGTTLRPFLHRCLFVVTQMDKIEDDEQEALLENVRSRLQEAFQFEHNVSLYAAAPKVVLDIADEQAVATDLQRWNDKFIELESLLWERLQRERTLRITERLLRLLTRLFRQLHTYVGKDSSGTSLAMQDDLIEIERIRTILAEKQKHLAGIFFLF